MRSQTEWENIFTAWSQGPTQTEADRCNNAESMIRSAIQSSQQLKSRDIEVFTQGSYRNRVNVRKDSDVDIGILCYDTFFYEYPDDNVRTLLEAKIASATYAYSDFKNDIESALVTKFGRTAVTRGDKAFDIKANTYRVEADVAAFFEHRRYTTADNYLSGVEMKPDSGNPFMVRNWPEQHYSNGVSKNTNTARRYKKCVRILKSLSNEMSSNCIQSAKSVPSFLVECLVFNAPNESFDVSSFYGMMRSILAWLFNNTMSDDKCSEWGEVSELKYLFKGSQPWTRQSAHQFLSDAWDYVGYQ